MLRQATTGRTNSVCYSIRLLTCALSSSLVLFGIMSSVGANLLFYVVDDRKGNPRRITLDKGGQGILVYFEY